MHVYIVVHGKSAANPELREAVSAVRKQGHHIVVRPTWEAGDGVQLAQLAVQEGADVVVAGGGDGTVNEVAMGLLTASVGDSDRPSFGILPLGTANDLARSAGIPLDPTPALEVIVTRPATAVDVGRMGDRMFLNVATGGFGTQITVETPETMKKALGAAAYLLTGLTRFTSISPASASFRGPDFQWEGAFLVLAIGNGRQAGGGQVLCKDALISDGLLDVNILPVVPEQDFQTLALDFIREGMAAVERMAVSTRLNRLEIESKDDIFINLDGEPISGRRFLVEVMPGAIRMHLPQDCPLTVARG